MDVVRQTFDRFCLLGWMRVQMHQRWGKTDAESWCKMRVCNSTILQFYSSTILQFCICTETNASQFLIFAADQSGLPRWWWGCRWEQVFRFRLGGCQCCQHFHDMYIISPPWWSSGKNLWKEMMYEKHKIQQITPWHHEVVSFCSKYLNWLQLKGRTNNSSGVHHTCDNPCYCRLYTVVAHCVLRDTHDSWQVERGVKIGQVYTFKAMSLSHS